MKFNLTHGQIGSRVLGPQSRWDSAFVASPLSLETGDRVVVLSVGSSAIAKTVPTRGNRKSSGKWYAEFLCTRLVAGGTTTNGMGVAASDFSFGSANLAGGTTGDLGAGLWPDSTGSAGRIYRSGTFITGVGISEPVTGSVVMVAMDIDARNLWFGVNGTWHNSGNPAAGTNASVASANLAASKVWSPACTPWSSDSGAGNETKIRILSGESECVYVAPGGFFYW